jgi:hypothetical protein
MNTDGAFYPDTGQVAIEVVIRDHVGTFRGGIAKWHPYGLDAQTMEAIAYREGVAYAGSRGIQKLQVETDIQELVKLWEMGDLQRSRVSLIIREITELCTIFHAFFLVYTNRSCNHVAHTLAKKV